MEKSRWFIALLLPSALVLVSCKGMESLTQDVSQAPETVTNPDVSPEATSGPLAPLTEAPTGYDNQTNGVASQTDFDTAKEGFDEVETIETGLGPVYNAQSCRECHQNPVTGAASQISEFRAGHFNGVAFVD